jgi:hypothetical protein
VAITKKNENDTAPSALRPASAARTTVSVMSKTVCPRGGAGGGYPG